MPPWLETRDYHNTLAQILQVDVADRLEKPTVVEPIDPFERCKLHRLNVSPRTASTDHLGFVEPNDRFRDGIVAGISRRSH